MGDMAHSIEIDLLEGSFDAITIGRMRFLLATVISAPTNRLTDVCQIISERNLNHMGVLVFCDDPKKPMEVRVNAVENEKAWSMLHDYSEEYERVFFLSSDKSQLNCAITNNYMQTRIAIKLIDAGINIVNSDCIILTSYARKNEQKCADQIISACLPILGTIGLKMPCLKNSAN